jgi:SdpI/YfhL protein family
MRPGYWEMPVAFRRTVLVGTLLIAGLILWWVPDSVRTRNPILLMIVALPMILGLLPRNRIYGMRSRYSMSSDGAWYRQNLIGGIALLLWGFVWLVKVIR